MNFLYISYEKKVRMLTLLGCHETFVTEDSCPFLMSLLIHLQKEIQIYEVSAKKARATQAQLYNFKFSFCQQK